MNDKIKFDSCEITAKSCCCPSEEPKSPPEDLKTYWNSTYQDSEIEKLGWYEDNPEPSLRLIKKCNLNKNARMLHVGTGASTLIDILQQEGFNKIIANDISEKALNTLQQRLGKDAESVEWIVDNLLKSRFLKNLEPVDLWHERAVLHFFTEKADQETYFNLLRKLVRPGGNVIIATFNLNSATTCSGLPVFRYDKQMLAQKLGKDFILQDHFNFNYTMPSGEKRAYVYTLFKRKR